MPKNVFYNSENDGFCPNNETDDCPGNGLHSVRECRENSKALSFYISRIH